MNNKHSFLFCCIIIVTVFLAVSAFGFDVQKNSHVLRSDEIISLAMSEGQQTSIYAASLSLIYMTSDEGESWKKIFTILTPNKKINKIYCDPEQENTIYVATQDGLYQSSDGGGAWKRIFQGRGDLENDCLSVAQDGGTLFVGTKEGLFVSYNIGKNWHKEHDELGQSVISSIALDYVQGDIYLSCEKGVFRIANEGDDLERLYVIYSSEIPSEDYNDYDGDISDKVITIKDIAISTHKDQRLYIATTKGIFYRENEQERWKKLSMIGLTSLNVHTLLLTEKNELFAATPTGAFLYKGNRWHKISDGFTYKEISAIKCDSAGVLWLAGEGGVYKMALEQSAHVNDNHACELHCNDVAIMHLFDNEPSISDVQRAAIEYAEVNMDKITSWRKQARLKALLPTLSVGYDKSVYGSSSGAMAIGPRDWTLDLSWDIGDLVWSSDQTSIDSRSRLTVQLRQDILYQVTRLFYERKKLKIELSLMESLPKSNEYFYKELELQEITANIDALTNGYFSHSIENHRL